MYQTEFSIFLGKDKSDEFIGYTSSDNFFGVLKIDDSFSKERGRELLHLLSTQITYQSITHLREFEAFLATCWRKENIPITFSGAFGYFHNDVLWVKTNGEGKIYLSRETKLVTLIEKDNSASGRIQEGDLLVFTTSDFSQLVESEDQLATILTEKKPSQIVETLTPILKEKDDQGVVALFVRWRKIEEEEVLAPVVTEEEQKLKKTNTFDSLKSSLSTIRSQLTTQDRKKTLTFIGVGIIIFIFFWSVVLGYQRRLGEGEKKKIQVARETVTEKLHQAEDVSFLNLPQATTLISESKDIVNNLKKDISDKNNPDIQSLTKLIAGEEGKILKKENRAAEEYFDFSLEDKEAQTLTMSLDGENIAVLNPKGTAYIFSLTKKSLEKRNSSDMKGASMIVFDGDVVYTYLKGSGIFKIGSDDKSSRVIQNDTEWQNIAGIVTYNKNLYLMDQGKDIYKYLVAANGFSDKSSYLKGDRPNLQSASSLAIDSAVYVGFDDRIMKFVSGAQDSFATSFPQGSVHIDKVITNKDLAKVYAWDREKAAVYIIAKTGEYEKEVDSTIFAKASDITVFQNAAYALSGAKLYKVSLQ